MRDAKELLEKYTSSSMFSMSQEKPVIIEMLKIMVDLQERLDAAQIVSSPAPIADRKELRAVSINWLKRIQETESAKKVDLNE